jgi:hypothetical protein
VLAANLAVCRDSSGTKPPFGAPHAVTNRCTS